MSSLTMLGAGHGPISLTGRWQCEFEPNPVDDNSEWATRTLGDTIDLPTTTDVAEKGLLNGNRSEVSHLTRKHPFEGVCWYRRTVDIPSSWEGKEAWLSLERTKASTVYLDGNPVGQSIALSTPQCFALGALAPGSHTIALRIDNRLSNWPDRVSASHMLEESTQTNWNGVLGRIEIRPDGPSTFEGVTTQPGPVPNVLRVRPNLLGRTEGRMTVQAYDGGRRVAEVECDLPEAIVDFGPEARLWDEFSTALYRLVVTVGDARWEGLVGLRRFHSKNGSLEINGRRVFLRGKHDACVFPLTGHPPMDAEGWKRVFDIYKDYGINHVRFHSWCPPEAAFCAADAMGLYLQPELPFWGDPSQPGVEPFLVEEGRRILRAYGHHASFVMLSLGNEYWGAVEPRPRMVAALRALDSSRLYAQGSNSEAWNPREFDGDDFRVGAYIKPGSEGEGRGSFARVDNRTGYILDGARGTSHTYAGPLFGTRLPFISHEIGQYQTYPNFGEIAKYTGALRADNLAVFRKRLETAGMLAQADDFSRASGRLSTILYREEVEAALRTPEMAGFQLLDLQDYPGQGTALVGILDAFLDSKGLVAPEEWRAFCGPVVPLALFDKNTWQVGERFAVEVRVANYGPVSLEGPVRWSLRNGIHDLAMGEMVPMSLPTGTTTTVGKLSFPLVFVEETCKLSFELDLDGRHSAWPIWVYRTHPAPMPPNVHFGRRLDQATLRLLGEGKRVVLVPHLDDLPNSVPGDFATDFWSYPMFKAGNPPGTLGYLIRNDHPALAGFPTESHSDWQWQTLAHHSRAVILDGFDGLRPIVQTIDNVERNHRLGTIFEATVGGGRLLVCAIDLPTLAGRPEADRLWESLVEYAASRRFRPPTILDGQALRMALHGPSED